ncbi:MAG: acetyl-CoA carboxylase carboxyltransferase subunit alpha [Verrucomicrobiota bacterium]|nr:acetyl-CoA carboxylase carboxyltransferase subunit alpha [Verrucomicrobiota bacterium]
MDKPQFILEFEKPLRDLEKQLGELQTQSREKKIDLEAEIASIEDKITDNKKKIYASLTPWQRVQLARHPKRPYSLDYIGTLFTDWQELHGDRLYGDDQALIGGTAFLDGAPVMIVAQQKGRDTRENLARNFGMPHPEGYRKALRLAKMAEKFKLPLLCLIDTKAAYAGVGSEERHVSEAIARNLRDFSNLRTPIITAILGEGGSGGALGIGVADRVLIFEYAYYSVIPPEGCAAILWRDRTFAPQAADALKIGARELHNLGIVDEVIEEPLGGAHRDPEVAGKNLIASIRSHLAHLQTLPMETLLEERYQKFRKMGVFEEKALAAAY